VAINNCKEPKRAGQTSGALLYLAALRGRTSIVKLLLDYGADRENPAPAGAARNGHIEVAKLLLETSNDVYRMVHGKQPFKPEFREWERPLLLASRNSHISMVKLLLDYGVNHHFPFLQPDCLENEQIVRLLLEAEANLVKLLENTTLSSRCGQKWRTRTLWKCCWSLELDIPTWFDRDVVYAGRRTGRRTERGNRVTGLWVWVRIPSESGKFFLMRLREIIAIFPICQYQFQSRENRQWNLRVAPFPSLPTPLSWRQLLFRNISFVYFHYFSRFQTQPKIISNPISCITSIQKHSCPVLSLIYISSTNANPLLNGFASNELQKSCKREITNRLAVAMFISLPVILLKIDIEGLRIKNKSKQSSLPTTISTINYKQRVPENKKSFSRIEIIYSARERRNFSGGKEVFIKRKLKIFESNDKETNVIFVTRNLRTRINK
jgi:hypothetical protein